jgi:hypothetical protein
MVNIGRNDLCWCGSGLKYKKCHLYRDKESKPKLWEVEKLFRREFSKKFCSVAEELKKDCSGSVIKAHSVSRSWLANIGEDSHVFGLRTSIHAIARNKGEPVPELIGINEASTFTGFCSDHDKALFAKIEDIPFTGTDEQCFLLAYRTVAREYFTKNSASKVLSQSKGLDKGMDQLGQLLYQIETQIAGTGTKVGLEDIKEEKSAYDRMLLDGDFRDLKYYIIEIAEIPQIMSSAGYSVSHDFYGNKIQDLTDLNKHVDSMSYSVIPTHTGGAIVFSWLENSNESCLKFIESVQNLDPEVLPSKIVMLLFEFCENNYISPSWWKGLDSDLKNSLLARMNQAFDPFVQTQDDCLANDDNIYVNWTIRDIETNI